MYGHCSGAKFTVVTDFGDVRIFKVGNFAGNTSDVIIGNDVALATDVANQRLEFASIDQSNFSFLFGGLIFVQQPKVCLNTRVVEKAPRELDDRLNHVVFKKPPADGVATRVTGKQRRPGKNDRALPFFGNFLHNVGQEEHRTIANFG